MAYFLKKSNMKKGIYMQIYESFYDPIKKQTAHKSYKPLGYVHELIEKGIDDPIAYYTDEVKKLNMKVKSKKAQNVQLVSQESPEKLLGYFPLKNINDSLHLKKYIDLLQSSSSFKFNIFELLSALVYSRAVHPCSKSKTFEDIIPKLFEKYDFSLDQLYAGLAFLGSEYQKIIEIYNHQIENKYKFDTSVSYFDCTNFYFEIDKEDDFRRKGPSKENRRDPIVSLGLLLDKNQLPIGMKLFPGNESEKPVLRSVIDELKKRNNIEGRTIHVADKGLNCGDNIVHSTINGDGYIFSKSVKMLPATEEDWILLANDYKEIKDHHGKLLYRVKSCVDEFEYSYKDSVGKSKKKKLKEKRIVTYNPKLAEKHIYELNKQIDKILKLRASEAKRAEYGDSAKFVNFSSTNEKGIKTKGKVLVELNNEAIEKARRLAGYNMIVTSEVKMSDIEIYDAYHNLWRIEESFRMMKSQLDARPVYLQKEDTIKGHFLVCYLTVVLTRILQIKILEDKYGTEELFELIRDFRIVKISDRKYVNLSKSTKLINELSEKTGLPINAYFMNNEDIKTMLNYRF